MPGVHVKDNVLSPDGPGFKAVVVMNGSTLSVDDVAVLTSLATDGLPILLQDDPSIFPSVSLQQAKTQELSNELRKLKSFTSVHAAHGDSIAKLLMSIGVTPFASIESNGQTWLTNARYDDREDIYYLYIFCASNSSTGHITVQHTGTPYLFDAWTGVRSPILHYQRNGTLKTITIPMNLRSKQTMLLAFTGRALDDILVPKFHLNTLPAGITAASYDSLQTAIIVNIGPDHDVQDSEMCVTDRDGTEHCMDVPQREVASSFRLQTWSLTMEHWEAPEDLHDIASIARRRNTSHILIAPLEPWTSLDAGLHNASGIGYYETSFPWPPSSGAADGAYLCLGTIVHAVKIYVNGNPVPALDPTAPRVDLGPFLRKGQNDVLAVVHSTMWNYVRSLLPELRTADLPAFYAPQYQVPVPIPGPSTNGLIGDVTIEPYWQYRVHEF